LKADGWHAVYIEPQPSFAGSLLGGLMPKRASVAAPMDVFAQAAWQQQLFVQRVAADLDMLTGVKGVQARCLECADFTPPTTPKADGGWLSVLAKLFA
jgi:protease IV